MVRHDSQAFDQFVADIVFVVVVEHGLPHQLGFITRTYAFCGHVIQSLVLVEEGLWLMLRISCILGILVFNFLDFSPRFLNHKFPLFEAWLEFEPGELHVEEADFAFVLF